MNIFPFLFTARVYGAFLVQMNQFETTFFETAIQCLIRIGKSWSMYRATHIDATLQMWEQFVDRSSPTNDDSQAGLRHLSGQK